MLRFNRREVIKFIVILNILVVLLVIHSKPILADDWNAAPLLLFGISPWVGSILGQCNCESTSFFRVIGGLTIGVLTGSAVSLLTMVPFLGAGENGFIAALVFAIPVGGITSYFISKLTCFEKLENNISFFTNYSSKTAFANSAEKYLDIGIRYNL